MKGLEWIDFGSESSHWPVSLERLSPVVQQASLFFPLLALSSQMHLPSYGNIRLARIRDMCRRYQGETEELFSHRSSMRCQMRLSVLQWIQQISHESCTNDRVILAWHLWTSLCLRAVNLPEEWRLDGRRTDPDISPTFMAMNKAC